MKRHKTYRKVRDRATGKTRSLHRVLAEQMLARPLTPGEIVHHRDGDSTNNALFCATSKAASGAPSLGRASGQTITPFKTLSPEVQERGMVD